MLGFECTINPQNLNSLEPILRKLILKFSFLCELPLILGEVRKWKKQAEDICKGTPDIEFEQDWSVGLDATLRERQKIKNYFF